MYYQRLLWIVSVTTSVSAFPSQIAKRQTWTGDSNGNIRIVFSDDKIRLGTVGIDEIMDTLSERCHTTGTCDTGDVSLDGQLIGSGNGQLDDITVTLHPDGSFPTWIHNGLLDALHAAVSAVAECEDVTHKSDCPNPIAYCPNDPFTVNECLVPRYWGINYQAPDSANAAPPFISTDIDMEIDSDGLCSAFTTVGAAVAGAVNGAAGGIFSLLELACN